MKNKYSDNLIKKHKKALIQQLFPSNKGTK